MLDLTGLGGEVGSGCGGGPVLDEGCTGLTTCFLVSATAKGTLNGFVMASCKGFPLEAPFIPSVRVLVGRGWDKGAMLDWVRCGGGECTRRDREGS